MTPADNRIDAAELLLGLEPDDSPAPEPARRVAAVPVPSVPSAPSAGGPDGKDVEDSVGGYLDYLSQLCRQLGVPDIVEEYFSPVVGRWTAMHEEAERWRKAGKAAGEVTEGLVKPLGGLDASWEGETADSFIAYMQNVGLAGNDLSDAMTAMAEVLDKTADGIREIVTELAGVLADTAESSSQAMAGPVAGEERTRQHIESMRRPTREFFESVKQILDAFVKLCDGIDGAKAFEQVKMAHTFPKDNWAAKIDIPAQPSPDSKTGEASAGGAAPGASGGGSAGGASFAGGGGGGGGGVGSAGTPAAPVTPLEKGAFTTVGEVPGGGPAQTSGAAAAAPASGGGGRGPGGGMGMGGMMAPMMGMGAGGGGGGQDHENKSRVVGNPEDIFGAPEDASPAVIGDEED
jgi:uncharacterized protein YukE